ncbi:MAG: transcriptional regulator [Gammaproteobacteria bacterium]|nr:transcriptional regulator [Gammaproteobacteria bacterium]
MKPSDIDEPVEAEGRFEVGGHVEAGGHVEVEGRVESGARVGAGGRIEAQGLEEGERLEEAERFEPVVECTMVSETLARIGDKWTVLVVELLCEGRGPVRFNEIRRAIHGISQRMLTLTLRSLERDGLVTRTVHPTVPPRVDYELTKLGRSLRVPLVAVAEWVRANGTSIHAARQVFDATSTASPSSRQVRRRRPALLTRPRLVRPEPG